MSNWVALSSLVNFTTKGITPKYVESSSIIVLNQKCIRNNKIDYTFAQYTDDTKAIPEHKFLQKGDILVNSTGIGTAGRCAFVSELPKNKKLIVDSHILILRCNSYHEAQCLSYSLYSFEKTLMSFMTGSSGQSELDKVILLSLKTKIPSDPISQIETTKVLIDLNSKIEANNCINAELESMAKLIYDYWFVQFDFPNAKGKPYKSSGGRMIWSEDLKRDIPIEWEVKELSKIASLISRGISPKYLEGGGICVLNQKCIRNKSIDFSLGRRHDNELKNAKLKFIKEGDVLVNSTGVGTLGRLAIVKRLTEKIVTVDSHVTIVRFEKEKLFFGYSLTEKQIEIESLAEGSTGQTELSRIKLGEVLMIVPSEPLLEKFETLYKPIFKKIANNESENERLKNLRDWLLPMLMNGQVTVGKYFEKKINLEQSAGQKSTSKKALVNKDNNKSKIDLDLAIIVALIKQELGITYGEVAMQKTVFNLCAFNSKVANSFKPYPFVNSNFGTYSYELRDDLKANPYLVKSKVKSHEVFSINTDHQKELTKELASGENKAYVNAIKKLLTIYKDPFINKETDKIELLNTVTKLILDLKTAELNKIYSAMGKWKIDQKGFKTKAEKFKKSDTKKMLELMEEEGLIKLLLNRLE